MVAQRASRYFRTLEDANKVIAQGAGQFNSTQHSVATSYFEVQGGTHISVVQQAGEPVFSFLDRQSRPETAAAP